MSVLMIQFTTPTPSNQTTPQFNDQVVVVVGSQSRPPIELDLSTLAISLAVQDIGTGAGPELGIQTDQQFLNPTIQSISTNAVRATFSGLASVGFSTSTVYCLIAVAKQPSTGAVTDSGSNSMSATFNPNA
jgi:hypothetical protein